MSLGFPNRIRSYDARNKRVRFWGHDSAIEIAFFVDEDALLFMSPNMPLGEAAILSAFDSNWSRIMEIARGAYVRGQSYSIVLTAADFGT